MYPNAELPLDLKLMKLTKIAIALYLSFFLNCASPGFGPPGFLFTNQKILVYSQGKPPQLTSTSCAFSLMGVVSWGDIGFRRVQSKFPKQEIVSVHWLLFSYFGIYAKFCTEIGIKE